MFTIKSRFKDGTLFLDIQFRLSQSVHLIVLGREVYGYAHICICYAISLLAMHAGTSCFHESPYWINTCCVECCLSSPYGFDNRLERFMSQGSWPGHGRIELLLKDLPLRCLVLCQVLPRKKQPFSGYNERVWQLNGLLREAVKGIHGAKFWLHRGLCNPSRTFLQGMAFTWTMKVTKRFIEATEEPFYSPSTVKEMGISRVVLNYMFIRAQLQKGLYFRSQLISKVFYFT